MDTNTIILTFFCGQLWSHVSAELKQSANSTSPTMLPVAATTVGGSPTHSYKPSKSGDPVKNGRQTPTAKPRLPTGEEPKPSDGHVIAVVLIGVILIVMIIVIVGIFLWRRWKKAAAPLPHWAGRSPFADGDVPDVGAEKEPGPGAKRMSVLSILPWKFNKDTQLLESVDGQVSESGKSLDASSKRGAEGTEKESSPKATDNSVSSTSMQTVVSEGSSGLIHVPLQSDDPDPLELPPPPNWLGGVNGDLGPNRTKSLSLEPQTEIQQAAPLDLPPQNPGETSLLPPPPEDFLCN